MPSRKSIIIKESIPSIPEIKLIEVKHEIENDGVKYSRINFS